MFLLLKIRIKGQKSVENCNFLLMITAHHCKVITQIKLPSILLPFNHGDYLY